VPRAAFWPKPEVDSAILKISDIKRETEKNVKQIEPKKFFRVVKIGFSSRRKQLQNNLAGGLRLENKEARDVLVKIGLDPKIRAENLDVDNWINLIHALPQS
jgi:16S rRNA (adenine1518-N6/adenine1519-N6)-dimethyltransferase